jgi:hypothetical protein
VEITLQILLFVAELAQGQGDVNVGDSVGSTLTQYTFVLGLFPLIVACWRSIGARSGSSASSRWPASA